MIRANKKKKGRPSHFPFFLSISFINYGASTPSSNVYLFFRHLQLKPGVVGHFSGVSSTSAYSSMPHPFAKPWVSRPIRHPGSVAAPAIRGLRPAPWLRNSARFVTAAARMENLQNAQPHLPSNYISSFIITLNICLHALAEF